MIKIGKHEIAEAKPFERVVLPGGGALYVRRDPRDGVTIETRDEIATGYGDTFQAATDAAVRKIRGYIQGSIRKHRRAADVEKGIAAAKADTQRDIERLRKAEAAVIKQIKRDAPNAAKRVERLEKQAALVKSWGRKP